MISVRVVRKDSCASSISGLSFVSHVWLFESTNIVSKQLQEPSLLMTRALPLVRAQIARIKLFPSRFDEMWNEADTSLSTLQNTDIHIASNLSRVTRSNRKTVQRDKLRMEFVTACDTVADDMKARYCSPDHDVMAQGLCAFTPGSEIFLNPPHICHLRS